MHLNFASSFTVGWVPASITICLSAYHMGTLGEAVNFRVKEYASNTVRYLAIRRGGTATTTGACFSDDAVEKLPDDASALHLKALGYLEAPSSQPSAPGYWQTSSTHPALAGLLPHHLASELSS